MKKIQVDPPSYGVFQLSGGTSVANTIAIRTANADRAIGKPGYAWADAPAKTGGLYRSFFKRALDLAAILLTLPFSLPVVLLCALALWIEGGTPFYRQERLGLNGKRFSIWKLRTMVPNADEVLVKMLAEDPIMRHEWNDLQKIKNDPRVTNVGHFLRITSLDELPQLWNVLKGDMSLVGPRPMLPEQLDMYGDARSYNAVRPGITGLWQVSARNANKFNYRREVDAAYERSLSLKNDLIILIKTVWVVLNPTGH